MARHERRDARRSDLTLFAPSFMSTELPTTPTDTVDSLPPVDASSEPVSGQGPEGSTAVPAPEGAEAPASNRTPEMGSAACLALLQQHFPALFPHQGPYRPLKLRIQADIQARVPGVFTRKALSITLHRHTTSTAYLRGLVSSSHRFDLDGQEAGELADEHRAAAKTELDRRQALMAERRAAERAAARAAQGQAPKARGPVSLNEATGQPSDTAELQQRHERQERPHKSEPRRHDTRSPRPSSRPQRPRRDDAFGSRSQGQARPSRSDGPRSDVRGESGSPARRANTSELNTRQVQAPHPAFTDPAQRDRQNLLRAWETTGLTKRNFCTLKGLSESDFDGQIALAQQERAARR